MKYLGRDARRHPRTKRAVYVHDVSGRNPADAKRRLRRALGLAPDAKVKIYAGLEQMRLGIEADPATDVHRSLVARRRAATAEATR